MSSSSDHSISEFEQSLEKLEAIVSQMEQGSLTLEQSLSAFEEGVTLTRNCQESLREAEQRVSKLVQNDTQMSEQPFQTDPNA